MTLDEKIEAYLDGKLPDEEAKSFAIQIDSDTSLAEQVAMHRLERELMDVILMDDLNENIQEWKKEKQQQSQPKTPEKQLKNLWQLLVIILILILGLLLVLFLIRRNPEEISDFDTTPTSSQVPITTPSNDPFSAVLTDSSLNSVPIKDNNTQDQNDKTEDSDANTSDENSKSSPGPVAQLDRPLLEGKLYDKYSTSPQPITTIVRGSNNQSTLLLDSASVYINNNNYQKAIEFLKEVEAQEEENYLIARFNIANLYYLEGEHQKAIPFYMEMSNRESIYQQTAQWRLLLSYLKLHQQNNYRSLLNQILQTPGHPFLTRAKQLADDLEGGSS